MDWCFQKIAFLFENVLVNTYTHKKVLIIMFSLISFHKLNSVKGASVTQFKKQNVPNLQNFPLLPVNHYLPYLRDKWN